MQDKAKFFSEIKGFSIAEAMITMLIVSIAMAAMAPIMSKKIQSDGKSSAVIPSGMVSFFNLSTCPNGWSAVNGSWNNRFIRIANGARAVGSTQEDAMLDASGAIWGITSKNWADANGVFRVTASPGSEARGQGTTWQERTFEFRLSFDPALAGRISNEVRPKNVALLACQKN